MSRFQKYEYVCSPWFLWIIRVYSRAYIKKMTTYTRILSFSYCSVGTQVANICWHHLPFCIFGLFLMKFRLVLVYLGIFSWSKKMDLWIYIKWMKNIIKALNAFAMKIISFFESTLSKNMFIKSTNSSQKTEKLLMRVPALNDSSWSIE